MTLQKRVTLALCVEPAWVAAMLVTVENQQRIVTEAGPHAAGSGRNPRPEAPAAVTRIVVIAEIIVTIRRPSKEIDRQQAGVDHDRRAVAKPRPAIDRRREINRARTSRPGGPAESPKNHR